MAEPKTLISAEEFLRLSSASSQRLELVDGEVVAAVTPGLRHGELAVYLSGLLLPHARRLGGTVAVEVGCWLSRDPDKVRVADVVYLAPERVPDPERRHKFLEGASDLVVEIVSPEDRVAEIQVKIGEYLAHGCRLLWLVEPESRTITIHRPDRSARVLTVDDMLSGEDVIPGFQVTVREVFEGV